MAQFMLLHEVKNEEVTVTDFNDYGEEIEGTLPEGVTLYTAISEKDLREGQRNVYALAL